MEKKFSWSFLVVMIYAAFVCRENIHYFYLWVSGSCDVSGFIASFGFLLLFSAIILQFFSVKSSWQLVLVYAVYMAFDALIGLYYCFNTEIRGDSLFNPGKPGAYYVKTYTLLFIVGTLLTTVLFMKINQLFGQKKWEKYLVISSGILIAFLYDRLLAYSWAHPSD